MALSAEEIEENERALAPGSGISDEERTVRLQVQQTYQDEHLSRALPAPDGPEQAGAGFVPSLSLIPQALAMQPATTHPAGDKTAESEWMVSGGTKGSVFVYEVPLTIAKKDLLEHPEKLRALYPNLIEANPEYFTPEAIMKMDHGSQLYEDYQNRTWLDTAAAAAAAGKTAYRYSKAPWLHGAGAAGVLDQLRLKPAGVLDQLQIKAEGAVQPYGEGITAFVMGVDDIQNLGAGQAAVRALNPELEPANPLDTERYGGITETDPTERMAQLREEYPGTHLGGQALGMLSGWGPAAWAFGQIMRGGRGVANLIGGAGTTGVARAVRVGTGTAAGALGAGAMQAGSDALEIGADQLSGTEGGLSPEQMPERAGTASLIGAPLAMLGAGASELASKRVHDIKWGNRYGGAPGQLSEDLGKEIKFRAVGGPKSQKIEDLKVEARKARAEPGDLIARDIAKPIATVLDQDVKGVFQGVNEAREAFIRSPEGKAPIPVRNFLEATAKELRADMQARGGQNVPAPVGKTGSGDDLVDLFNTQVDRVSLEPVEGAVALSPEEAQAFLGRDFRRDLLRAKPVKAPPGGPRAPFGPADDLPKAPTLEARPLGVGEPSPPPHLPTTKPGAGDWRSPRPINAGEPLAATPQTPVGKYEYHRAGAPESAPQGPLPLRGNREPAMGGPPGAGATPPAAEASPAPTMSQGSPPEPKSAENRAPRSAEPRERLPRGKGLADTLRKRGVDAVYVVPRSYDAEHTETLLDKIAATQKKGDRDLEKLDKAARVDRDERTLGGEKGAWSRLQNQHSELIEKSKLAEQLGAPGGESFKVLSGYHKQKAGDLLRGDVLRDAASRAGVREQLDRIRSLEPYEQLRKQSNFETMAGDPHRGRLKRYGDFASIRSLPFWSALEGPLGPLSAGQAGRAAALGPDDDEKERRKKRLQKEAEQ